MKRGVERSSGGVCVCEEGGGYLHCIVFDGNFLNYLFEGRCMGKVAVFLKLH